MSSPSGDPHNPAPPIDLLPVAEQTAVEQVAEQVARLLPPQRAERFSVGPLREISRLSDGFYDQLILATDHVARKEQDTRDITLEHVLKAAEAVHRRAVPTTLFDRLKDLGNWGVSFAIAGFGLIGRREVVMGSWLAGFGVLLLCIHLVREGRASR